MQNDVRIAPQRVPPALPAATPLLLLPVRIETRFVDAGGAPALWVRIYPDQISLNSHEAELSDDEVAAGTAYWDGVWRAGKPPAQLDDLKAPWRALAARFGAPRAAWIVRELAPQNPAAQPVAPTPPNQPLPVAPQIPVPPHRASSWEKPARADLLPHAWTVVTVSGSVVKRFTGSPVVAPLAVGLTPNAGAFPDGLPVDEGMKWLVDFDAAVQAGMALRIPLTADERATGFTRLLVYGLRAAQPDGVTELQALLDAHHYTDGFAFVPQGAPTNNTPDADAGYTRRDDGHEISFAVERQSPLNADAACDGAVTAQLLGMSGATFEHVRFADGTGSRNGAGMLTALWPATMGYFLSQMMHDVFSEEQIETARRFTIENVRPRGPLPAIRVGNVPYGIVPATSLRFASEREQSVAWLVDFVRRLLPTWLASADGTPRVGGSNDPDRDLAGILGMDASSMNVRGRQVVGDDFLWSYYSFSAVAQSYFASWWDQHAAQGRAALDKFGFQAWNPRVLAMSFRANDFGLRDPLVQSGPLSESEPLKADADLGGGVKGNYIAWLATASTADIQHETYPGPKPAAVLYKLLRQSVLRECSDIAASHQLQDGRLTRAQLLEQELVDVRAGAPTVTPWDVLARRVSVADARPWSEFLALPILPPQFPFNRLSELRASLKQLAAAPTAELERLLTETLDTFSHRLDAWVSSIANALLAQRRAQAPQAPQVPQGLNVGAYAWIEGLRPATRRNPVANQDAARVRRLDGLRDANAFDRRLAARPALEPLTDNGGFILAPSIAQASVAAVLRNGYMTHRGSPGDGMLALDLSSERMRRALWLIDGVRQGQPLAALLGYRFEERLHALGLDKYAQPFRDRFPIVGAKLTPLSAAAESVAASNVVDGLGLKTAWDAGDAGSLPRNGDWGPDLPPPGADRAAVVPLFDELDDSVAAIGELSMAESIFQIGRGNFERGSGLLDAVSQGLHPPDVQVLDTQRGGLDLTHRIMVLIAGQPVRAAAWQGFAGDGRAAAEPALDAWVSARLPDPTLVTCRVTFTSAGAPVQRTISLRDLAIGPLDLLEASIAAPAPQRSELEDRILFAAALPADAADVKIVTARPVPAPGTISFAEAIALARALRDAIGGMRALLPQDLIEPERDAVKNGAVLDVVDYNNRATAARTALSGALAALQTAAAGLPGSAPAVRAALIACSPFGVLGSIPHSGAGGDPAALAAQSAGVAKELLKRRTAAAAVVLAPDRIEPANALFAAVFGAGFVALPRFKPPDLAVLRDAFAQSPAMLAVVPDAADRWFQQLTHVRPGVSRLDLAVSAARLLADPAPLELEVAQLPAVVNDRWLALPLDPARLPASGRVALAAFASGDVQVEDSWCGLLVDEFVERIPKVRETAAVAFHFEEPRARAPQALLLAVCPDARKLWDDEILEAILNETLDLAKVRTVDLATIQDVGQILPALYIPLNLDRATISSEFFVMENIREPNLGGPG